MKHLKLYEQLGLSDFGSIVIMLSILNEQDKDEIISEFMKFVKKKGFVGEILPTKDILTIAIRFKNIININELIKKIPMLSPTRAGTYRGLYDFLRFSLWTRGENKVEILTYIRNIGIFRGEL